MPPQPVGKVLVSVETGIKRGNEGLVELLVLQHDAAIAVSQYRRVRQILQRRLHETAQFNTALRRVLQ